MCIYVIRQNADFGIASVPSYMQITDCELCKPFHAQTVSLKYIYSSLTHIRSELRIGFNIFKINFDYLSAVI
jgi:hypothetical protein